MNFISEVGKTNNSILFLFVELYKYKQGNDFME